jgi:hypothetical protein
MLDRNLLTIQNTPKIAPQTVEKNNVNPNDLAGNHSTKQLIPQRSVSTQAVATLEKRSLTKPIRGRPTAVPTFKKPTISVACLWDSPMARENSESENSRII